MDIFGDQVTMYVKTCDLALFRSDTDRILQICGEIWV